MKLTQNKLSVILATAMAGAAIIVNCVSARAVVNPKMAVMENRYIIAGTVDDKFTFDEVHGKVWVSIVDENGEGWCNAYDENEKYIPNVGQGVTMIMNNNGTADDITDDIIEDMLFCNDCENIIVRISRIEFVQTAH